MQQYIKRATTIDELKKILELRCEVFCFEQFVPIEEEIDDYDQINLKNVHHFGFYEGNEIVGCFRIIIYPTYYKIGRVCVKKEYRNKQIGFLMLSKIISFLTKKRDVILESQITAVKFYERLGFHTEGEIFIDANIEHITMIRAKNE